MSKLFNLIKNLKAFTVIIVENDFTYETDPEKLLGKFCLKKTEIKSKILEDLAEGGFGDIEKALSAFDSDFTSLKSNEEEILRLPASVYFSKYLDKIGGTTLLEDHNILEEIRGRIAGDEPDQIVSIFLKHGIFANTVTAYEELLNALHGVDGIQIFYYKQRPASHQLPHFFEYLKKSIKETESEFYLAIIDKILGTGSNDEEGKIFITNDLIPQNKIDKLKAICCIFSSKPQPNIPEIYDQYFIQEINKHSATCIDEISQTLAQVAYAEVFNEVKNKYIKSSEDALSTVLKNQKNIKYILEKSPNEGIPPYEAIKYWFSLSQQQKFENIELNDLKFIASLTNFFNEEHLADHPLIGLIGDELKALNSFELFDFNVNKKHLSVAPGDIWKAGEDYYILMGQACDILLRENNKRKAKVGELLKLSIQNNDFGDKDDKYFIKVEGDSKYVIIKHFFIEEGQYKSIVIEISSSTNEYSDLTVLDLGMFHTEGECNINFEMPLDSSIKDILLPNIRDYYLELVETFQNIAKLFDSKGISNTDLIQSAPVLFSKFSFIKSSDNSINFGIRRVGRLKGRYFDSLYNNYLNNKGRIDLNLIDNAPEEVIIVKLSCSFFGDPDSLEGPVEVNLWSKNGKEYFKKAELQKFLSNNFQELISFNDENILIEGSQEKHEVLKGTENYELKLKYRLDKANYSSKDKFSYKQLFAGAEKPKSNPHFQIEGETENQTFLNEAGFAVNTLSIQQLKQGVRIYEKNIKIQLVNGILIQTDL